MSKIYLGHIKRHSSFIPIFFKHKSLAVAISALFFLMAMTPSGAFAAAQITLSAPGATGSPNSALTVCSGTSVTFTATFQCSPGAVTKYEWKIGGVIQATHLVTTTSDTWTTSTLANSNVVTCTVTFNNSGSCNGSPVSTNSITVTVNTSSTAPTGASVDVNNFCSGTSGNVSLSATGGTIGAGALVKWYSGSCGGTLVGTGNPLSIAKPISTTSYYARYENTCNITTCAQIDVIVNPLPALPTGIGASRCGTGTVAISATPGAGVTIDWFAASSGGSALLSGNTSFTTPSISTTTTYYSQARNTATGCISATRTAVVATINTVPSAPSVGNNSRCGTGTVNITATSAGNLIDWYDAASGGTLLLSANTSYTTPSISTTTIYYAETRTAATGCISAARTAVTATVNAVPVAPTGTGNARCGSGTVVISATPGAGETIDWYAAATGGSALLSGNTNFTTPSIATTTIYYAQSRNTTTGCISATRTAVTATVNSVPSMTSPNTATICSGGTVSIPLTSSVASSYTWIATDNLNTTGESTAIQNTSTLSDAITNNTTSVQTVTYTATPTSTTGTCVGGSQTVTVTVYAPPVITNDLSLQSQTVCNTYPAVFTVNATGDGLTYEWFKDASITPLTDNASITGSNTFQLTIDPTASTDAGTYHVVVSGNAACTAATSANAILNIDQVISITTQPTVTQTLCEGSTFSLTVASTGSNLSYQWRRGGSDIIGATSATLTLNNITLADASTQYDVVIIDAAVDPSLCNTAFSNKATLIVNKKSLDPTSITAGATTICNGGSTTLTLVGGGGGTGETITWYSASCGGTSVGNGNGITVNPTTTTTYYGRYEDGAPCNYSSNCASITITVNQKSTDPTSATASVITICNGQSTILTLNGGGGGDVEAIKWYSTSCGAGLVGTGNNLSVSPTVTTTYYGRYEDGVPCSYNSLCASITITVNQKSANPTSATATLNTICNGGSTALSLVGGGGGTGPVITWYSGSCGGTLVGTGNSLSVSPTTTTTYYGRYENGAPCNFSTTCASITITVSQPPTTSDAGPDQTICGTSATLAANTPAIGTGAWSIVSGAGGSVTTPSSPTSAFTGTAGTTYTLRWTISNNPCTTSTDNVIIAFKQNPTTANAGPDKSACGTSTNLAANNPASGTGTWSVVSGPAGYSFGNINSNTSSFSNPSLTSATTYTLTWTISNAPCAASSDNVDITFYPPLINDSIQVQSFCRDQSTGIVTLFFGPIPPGISGGSGTYTYSWEISCSGGNSWSTLAGQTGASLAIQQSSQNCFYRRLVTSSPCATEQSHTLMNQNRIHINLSNNISPTPFSIIPTPTAAYCVSAVPLGVEVKTSGSIAADINNAFTPFDVRYDLYLNGVFVQSLTGTGSPLNFGYKTTTGLPYTITETIILLTPGASSCSATNLTGSLTLSLDQSPTIANAGPNQTVCGSATATLAGNPSAAPYGTGTWSVFSGPSLSTTQFSSTTNPTAVFTPAGGPGIYVLRWTISNTCSSNFSDMKIYTSYIWSGAANTTDWFTALNWLGLSVPAAGGCANVIIPVVGTNKYPVITSGKAIANNISISSGASVIVNGTGTIQVAGLITNAGLFDVTGGTLELNGTSIQTITGTTFVAKTLNNLTISNNVNVNGPDTLKISGQLGFGAVSSKTFNAAGNNVTLLSSLNGTANVGQIINGNVISGTNFTVERFIPTGTNHAKSWQLLATPTEGQTIKASWQEGATQPLIPNGNTPATNPHPGYGTMLTSAVAGATNQPTPGFDAFTAPGPSIKTYVSTTDSYDLGPSSTANQLYNQKGYIILVRGDRSVYTSNGAATPTVLRSSGTLFTPAKPPPSTSVANGYFESIGNPYASALDLHNISKTADVGDFFYVWDPQLNSYYGLGAYQTLGRTGGLGDNNYYATPGGGSYGSGPQNYIQSGQAFLVPGNGPNAIVSFTESAKASGSTVLLFAPNRLPQPQKLLRTTLSLINSDGSASAAVDGALIQFGSNYSDAVDGLDARKIANTSVNLSIKTAGKLLAIERRPDINQNDTIFLNLTGVRVQQYQFTFNAENMNPRLEGFLEDNYLHTRTPFNTSGSTEISFNVVNIPGAYAADRFRIVFAAPSVVLPVTFTSVKAYRHDKNINVEWSVENEMNIKQYEVEKSTNGNQFTTMAVKPAIANGGRSAIYVVADIKPVEGYNYYRVKSVDMNGKTAYTSVVKVSMGSLKQDITIYPNPITDGMIHLQLMNQPEGNYGIRLLNNIGQVMVSKQINHGEGSSTELIKWNYNLAHGMYHLEVTRPDGKVKNINVMY